MPAIVVHHDDPVATPLVAPLPPGKTMAEVINPSTPAKPNTPTKDPPAGVNRPDESRWTQQRLAKWEPMLTLDWALALSLIVAITAIGLGVAILSTSASLTTLRVVYDDGGSGEATATQEDGSVSDLAKCQLSTADAANSFHADHTCYVTFTLPETVSTPLLVFYELDNFFQHHRRFVSSLDRTQLTGEWSPGTALTACAPLETADSPRCLAGNCEAPGVSKTRELFPCGMVANSMFNDIFWLHTGRLPTGETLERTDLVSKGVARAYTNVEYKNPAWLDEDQDDGFLPVWRNPNMSRLVPSPSSGSAQEVHVTSDYTNSTAWVHDPLDPEHGAGTGVENELWRVWVEGAAVEPFRKAYARIDKYPELPKGTTLTFAVQSNFFVGSFAGTKAIVVGQVGWFGSENVPLGAAFVAVGGVFMVAAVLAAARKCRGGRPLGDAAALDWKKRQSKHKEQ